MNDYDKLCDTLIRKAGGENECQRFQERIELGTGGIHARLHIQSHHPEDEPLDEEFGHRVIIRDVSRSGIGLLSLDSFTLDKVCYLQVVDMPPLKGTLIYCNQEPDGRNRYGFSLDEWLTDDAHQKLAP